MTAGRTGMKLRTAMSFMEHMKELRKHLIVILAVFVVLTAAGMAAAPYVLAYIKSQPPASELQWNAFSPLDGVRIYLTIAVAFGLAASLPAALYLIWRFVRQGLHPHERKAALRYIPYSMVCLLLGLAFGYYVVLPMCFSFIQAVSARMELAETYGVAQYFGFMFNLVLPVAAAFELPIVIIFLTRIGLLTPERLRKSRRFVYLILVIAANLMSPPDFISAFIILIPLIVLFEISIWLCRRTYRSRALQAGEAAV